MPPFTCRTQTDPPPPAAPRADRPAAATPRAATHGLPGPQPPRGQQPPPCSPPHGFQALATSLYAELYDDEQDEAEGDFEYEDELQHGKLLEARQRLYLEGQHGRTASGDGFRNGGEAPHHGTRHSHGGDGGVGTHRIGRTDYGDDGCWDDGDQYPADSRPHQVSYQQARPQSGRQPPQQPLPAHPGAYQQAQPSQQQRRQWHQPGANEDEDPHGQEGLDFAHEQQGQYHHHRRPPQQPQPAHSQPYYPQRQAPQEDGDYVEMRDDEGCWDAAGAMAGRQEVEGQGAASAADRAGSWGHGPRAPIPAAHSRQPSAEAAPPAYGYPVAAAAPAPPPAAAAASSMTSGGGGTKASQHREQALQELLAERVHGRRSSSGMDPASIYVANGAAAYHAAPNNAAPACSAADARYEYTRAPAEAASQHQNAYWAHGQQAAAHPPPLPPQYMQGHQPVAQQPQGVHQPPVGSSNALQTSAPYAAAQPPVPTWQQQQPAAGTDVHPKPGWQSTPARPFAPQPAQQQHAAPEASWQAGAHSQAGPYYAPSHQPPHQSAAQSHQAPYQQQQQQHHAPPSVPQPQQQSQPHSSLSGSLHEVLHRRRGSSSAAGALDNSSVEHASAAAGGYNNPAAMAAPPPHHGASSASHHSAPAPPGHPQAHHTAGHYPPAQPSHAAQARVVHTPAGGSREALVSHTAATAPGQQAPPAAAGSAMDGAIAWEGRQQDGKIDRHYANGVRQVRRRCSSSWRCAAVPYFFTLSHANVLTT